MISTTNTVKNILIVFLQLFNIVFAIEYIILSTDDLKESAEKISSIYSDTSQPYYLDVEIAIIDTFSITIKDFINNKIENNSNLKYLLIIGDENEIPSLTKSVSCGNGLEEYPSDDFFSSVNENTPPRLSTGRIPTSNPQKALSFATKLEEYIKNPTIGAWKNKILLISDDEIKNNSSVQSEIQHTIYSDSIYQKISSLTFSKTLYGPMYEAEYYGSERRLPQLTEDIIEYLNDGAAIINYIGHGDPETWSAENIIDKNRDIELIDIPNSKLPIWIAGTCYFGRYDNVDSMSEALLFETNGAISVIGATRSISKSINKKFLEYFYDDLKIYIEQNDEIIRLGDIFLNSKTNLFNAHTTNYHYTSNCDGGYLYDILGDPAIPLPFPGYNENIINFTDSINILTTYTIDPENDQFNDYQYIQILDEDVEIVLSYEDNGDIYNYEFSYSPNIIFENEFSESSCYTAPIDLISSNYINFKFYTESNNYNYIKYSSPIHISYNNDTLNDYSGPDINFYLNNSMINSNEIVSQNENIVVMLFDSLGINTSANIGHLSRYWFNNEEYQNNIQTEDCIVLESCTNISCEIDIPPSIHDENILYVESWDNANNMTIDSLKLTVINPENDNIIFNLFNIPNPITDRTFFTYQIKNNQNKNIETKIKIYSQSGEFITSLTDNRADSFVAIEWDTTDLNSNLLPNGTYLYTIEIKTENKLVKDTGVFSIIR